MPVVADVHITHPSLVLVPTIRAVPDARIEVVADSTTAPDAEWFPFLVTTDDFAAFESALDDDPTAREPVVSADFGESRTYQIAFGENAQHVSSKAAAVGGLLLEAVSAGDGWNLRLQLPDRAGLADLNDYCERNDIDLAVHRVYGEEAVDPEGPVGVTEPQREALVAAYETGYFQQPRAVSLDELAERLDISSTAAGGRLRRGMENLVEATLVER
jgi:predicted DNA binding protein